jgi:selenocysteine lyase/cysteine desulfurase
MTALTYELARTLAKSWGPGDEVVVTSLDHDANIRPWVHAAASVGAIDSDIVWEVATTRASGLIATLDRLLDDMGGPEHG